MAKKIPFNIIFASDEDSEFPASELNTHSPSVYGWRSQPGNTIVPKDIVLRFQEPSRICKIQVLAHQYLIPQKIELWLHYSPRAAPSTPSSQHFDYLGFIALSDNSSTNYQSRELQSVTVQPCNGTYLKLRIASPYDNKFNKNKQVALIAVNVLGEELRNNNDDNVDDDHNSIKDDVINQSEFKLSDNTNEPILSSICDDLLFSMYVEESIAEIIRKLEKKKLKAVTDERFEYARKLKLCMTALRNAGERLGRYSLAKRQAVQQEDFTTAKLRKEQIEIYRSSVLKELLVDQLLEEDGLNPDNDTCSDLYATKPILPSPPSLQDVATLLSEIQSISISSPKNSADEKCSIDGSSSTSGCQNQCASDDGSHHHKDNFQKSLDNISSSSPQYRSLGRSPIRSSPACSRQGSLRRRNKSAPRNSYEDYEERAVPALRHSHTNEFLRECQGSAILDNDLNRGRSRLNDREKRQAALPIFVFGIELVELFYSRQFQDREDGLIRLRNFLKSDDSDFSAGPNKIARSATLLLHRSVRDAVYSVFSQATETVRALFLEFVPNRVSLSEVARCVDRLLPELLAKSGDPSSRIHTLAQHTILSIADCPQVREQHLIAPSLSRTISSTTHPRLALSRMQMLEQLVLSQGINTNKQSGLTCRTLSECGCSGIHHPAEPVRKVAERVLLLVYKVNPRLVRKQLPPDDDITRRNLLYRQLFAEFDKLDMQRKSEMLENNNTFLQQSKINDNSNKMYLNNSKDINYDKKLYNTTKNMMKTTTTTTTATTITSLAATTKQIQKSDTTKILNTQNDNLLSETDEISQIKRNINSNSSNTNSHKNLVLNSSLETSNNKDSMQCPFCDWSYNGDDQTQLDKHYWKSCPFLTKCPQCSQVLEVAALNYHLINECEAKDNYVTCKRCTEAIHKELYQLHLLEDYCTELKTGAARCPLCHDDVHLPLDGGWKLHLLSLSGCSGNTRRRSKT